MKTTTHHSRSSKQDRLYENFLTIITLKSTFTACQMGDDKLLPALGYKSSTTLQKMIRKGLSLKDISVKTEVFRDGSIYKSLRTIFLVSKASVEEGALMLATLLADIGETVSSGKRATLRLCGQLRCTPDQLALWEAEVVARGWFVRTEKGWARVKGASFTRVSLPDRLFIHGDIGRLQVPERQDVAFAKEPTSEEIVYQWIVSQGGRTSLSLAKIGEAVGLNKQTVASAVKGLQGITTKTAKTKKEKRINVTVVGQKMTIETVAPVQVRDDLAAAVAMVEAQIAAKAAQNAELEAYYQDYPSEENVVPAANQTASSRAGLAVVKLMNYKLRKAGVPQTIGYVHADEYQGQIEAYVAEGINAREAARMVKSKVESAYAPWFE